MNIDKRHAFVKMINRHDAVSAREGMEQYKSGDMQLRVSYYPCCILHLPDVVHFANAITDTLGRGFWTQGLQRLPDRNQRYSN